MNGLFKLTPVECEADRGGHSCFPFALVAAPTEQQAAQELADRYWGLEAFVTERLCDVALEAGVVSSLHTAEAGPYPIWEDANGILHRTEQVVCEYEDVILDPQPIVWRAKATR